MEESKKKTIEGTALAIALLIISIFLYLYPNFIGAQLVTRSIGVIFGLFGVLFFLSELTNISFSKNKILKSAISDITLGAFFGIIIFILIYFFTNWFVHLIVTFLMIFALFGVLKGIITILVSIDFSKGNRVAKIPVIILNIAIFTLTILQLLQIFKVIDE